MTGMRRLTISLPNALDEKILALRKTDKFVRLGGDVLGIAGLVLGDIPLVLQLLGGGGLLQRPIEFPMAAIRTNLVEPLPAEDVELGVPEGVVIILAVGDNLAVRPAHDDFQSVQEFVEASEESINHDTDNLVAVGEVDVCVVALAAAHCPGVDGVAFR